MENNELKHWGVKGMRWGVRRYQNKDGSLTPAGKKRYEDNNGEHDDYKSAHDSRSVKDMSNKELQDRLNRLRNEQQYTDIMKQSNVSSGKSAVMSALKKIGAGIAMTYATKAAQGLTDAALKKAASGNPELDKVFKTMKWI